jgi:hypothetical protein
MDPRLRGDLSFRASAFAFAFVAAGAFSALGAVAFRAGAFAAAITFCHNELLLFG